MEKGHCYICGENLGKNEMKIHLLKSHQGDAEGQDCYILKVESIFDKNYWLYIDAPVEKPLSAIDGFLRRIWLECCGHCSEFYINLKSNDKKWTPNSNEHFQIRMNEKLKIFSINDTFFHLYDYGSTTELAITVIGRNRRKTQRLIVRVLARNDPPVHHCADCGKKAMFLRGECIELSENSLYCMDCAEKYKDDEHFLHVVTNSPRMGVCGYEGEYDDYEYQPWKAVKDSEN